MNETDFWIGTSWKMNKTIAEAQQFAKALAEADADRNPRVQRFVVPPFTAVREVASMLASTSVMVGAQNMHWEDKGAWTGEISPLMLIDCGVEIVELGHSERRLHFGETNQTVGIKVAAAVRHGLIPLICVGETLTDRDAGRARTVLEQQTRSALAVLTDEQKSAQILFAYEPVWAIGIGGTPATTDYANARQAEIVAVAKDVLGRRIRCLYGGSVNLDNCVDLMNGPHVDGLFIGRAAWDVAGYLGILALCSGRL